MNDLLAGLLTLLAATNTPAAVSNAGGLGSLGIGASTLAQARSMIERTQQLTARPFNVNLFCHAPAQPDARREQAWLAHLAVLFAQFGAQPPAQVAEIYQSFVGNAPALQLLLELRPAVVSFHFGLPPVEDIAALRAAGIVTLATATSLAEAQAIEQAGVDAIVAQGIEAGGHRGIFDPQGNDERLSTSCLLRQLAQGCGLPLIAAGGIMDGQGIRAALQQGAIAAQLGTAFVACPESAASAAYRSALLGPRASHTRLTCAISGRPARGILNQLIAHGDAAGSPPVAGYPQAYDAAKQLHALASAQDNHEFAAFWAGQGAPLARALPAAELVRQLISEMQG